MTVQALAVERLRITFSVDDPLNYVSVLDMGRLWERLLRRAGLPLAYTQGFHPHPRVLFASPLPVGYRSTAELVDVFLSQPADPAETRTALERQCPQGLAVLAVERVDLASPVLQAQLVAAEYAVTMWSDASEEAVRSALDSFMQKTEVPRERERKGRPQNYNLRELFTRVAYEPSRAIASPEAGAQHALSVRARSGSKGAGRPEELLQELGIAYSHYRITRTRLIWGEEQETLT